MRSIQVFQLKPFQKEIVDKLRESIKNYNEAGMEVFTAAGKTFMALDIAIDYILKYDTKYVIWIGPQAANNNVKNGPLYEYAPKCIDNFKFISYEQLSRIGDNKVPVSLHSNASLIIMDECHSALATQTYKAIKQILARHTSIPKLVMTATSNRDSDNIDSISKLVPKAYSNRAIVRYALPKASKEKIINSINYYIIAQKFSAPDIEKVTQLKSLAGSFKDSETRINNLIKAIQSYNMDRNNRLYNSLKEYIYSNDRNASARYIVFFNKIALLKQDLDLLKISFSKLYPNAKEIRVFEYDNSNSRVEEREILSKAVHSDPIPGVIDIIATVNKGIQSIHPKGIKAILLFRGTSSVRVYTQEVGRLVSLKSSLSNQKAYVFDFSDNLTMLNRMSIGVGVREVGDRFRQEEDNVSYEKLIDSIKRDIGSTFNIDVLDCTREMMTILTEYDHIVQMCRSRKNYVYLKMLKDRYIKVQSVREYPSTDRIFEAYYNDENKNSINIPNINDIITWASYDTRGSIKSKLLNRTINDQSDIDIEAVKLLGHTLYLKEVDGELSDNHRRDELYMTVLDRIAAKQAAGISVSDLTGDLKERYKTILRAACNRNLHTNVAAYATLVGVELDKDAVDTNYLTAYKDALTIKQYESIEVLTKLFKSFKLATDKQKQLDLWIKIKAKSYMYLTKEKDKAAVEAIKFLLQKNNDSYAMFNSNFSIDDIELRKFAIMCDKLTDKTKTIVGEYQRNILSHSCKYSKYSLMEQRILSEFGINQDYFDNYIRVNLEYYRNIKKAKEDGNSVLIEAYVKEGEKSGIPYMVALAQSVIKEGS